MLGLSLAAESGDYSLDAVHGLFIVVVSLVAICELESMGSVVVVGAVKPRRIFLDQGSNWSLALAGRF